MRAGVRHRLRAGDARAAPRQAQAAREAAPSSAERARDNAAVVLHLAIEAEGDGKFTDLLFQPRVPEGRLLDWSRFEEMVAAGYSHARQVLAGLTDEQREMFR